MGVDENLVDMHGSSHFEMKTVRIDEKLVDMRGSSHCVFTRRRQLYDSRITNYVAVWCTSIWQVAGVEENAAEMLHICCSPTRLTSNLALVEPGRWPIGKQRSSEHGKKNTASWCECHWWTIFDEVRSYHNKLFIWRQNYQSCGNSTAFK
jgi:hypothetical protein